MTQCNLAEGVDLFELNARDPELLDHLGEHAWIALDQAPIAGLRVAHPASFSWHTLFQTVGEIRVTLEIVLSGPWQDQ